MRYRYRVLGMLFLLSILTYLDRVCISVAGPRMQQDLGIPPERWGWVVGAFTLSYAFFEIPTGSMGDRIGPRRVITRIVLWWSAFTALTGSVSSFKLLLLVRFLFGAGEAGAYPNCSATISRWFPVVERARAQGVVWMASRIGGALSPVLVVPIQMAFGWRMSFWVFGVVGILWAIWWYAWFRDNPSEKPAVTAEEIAEIGNPPRKAHESLPWRIALRTRNLWFIMLMYHTYCWGSYFYLSWLHTYLQKGRGFSEKEMGFYSTLPFICGACGNLFGGWLSDRLVKKFGVKWGRMLVGCSGLALSGCLLVATGLTENRLAAVVFLALGYGAQDCFLPVAWAVCLDVGRKYAGAVTGAMNMAGQFGSFLSSVAFGYMVKYFGNYDTPLLGMGCALFVSAFLFSRIDASRQLVPASEPSRTTA